MVKNFASDNNSGALPQMFEAMAKANVGHVHAYGGDEYTERTVEKFKEFFGKDIEVFFVFNGTAANVLSIKAFLKTYESVLCAETSHLHMDECGAPELLTGCKLKTLSSPDGKITLEQLEKAYIRLGDQHATQPKMVSITQPTEYGTVYTQEEIKAIADWAHKHQCFLHVDGSRFPNACVSLGKSFKELTKDVGVDVLSFGGTKNGLVFGEAVVFFNTAYAKDFKYYRKQFLQLGSKSRFIAAQFEEYLSNNLWKKTAEHSLKMAQLLRSQLSEIPQVKITQKTQSNAVFAVFPRDWLKDLKEKNFFYVWDENTFECRLMTTFDTTEEQILDFTALAKKLSGK
jgi:threonine aldolase